MGMLLNMLYWISNGIMCNKTMRNRTILAYSSKGNTISRSTLFTSVIFKAIVALFGSERRTDFGFEWVKHGISQRNGGKGSVKGDYLM